MDFNYTQYWSTKHALKRLYQRSEYKNRQKGSITLIQLAKKGDILLDVGKHRYIRTGEYFLPCLKVDHGIYLVKSVLTWDMVKDRMQRIIDNYAK